MTELSGTLEGVGLPALVRFLTGLSKTGCLRISHDEWRGEIFYDAGRVTNASLGSRQGLAAFDALVAVLPGGSFAFDSLARADGPPNIALSTDALQAHLEDLANRAAGGGTPALPSLDAVPVVVAAGDSRPAEDPLALDRGTLQTLLAVDGQRNVREIVAGRGSPDALWQLGNLIELGLISQGSARSAPAATVARPVATPASVEPEVPDTASLPRCPKLGFEDDPANSFARPTRLHRCFAAGTPLALSIDQQRELCLSDQFATCPRLTTTRPVEADTNDPRIVRLPIGRTSAAERGAAADRQAVGRAGGGAEPTRLRPANPAPREPDAGRPMPLRSRIDRSVPAPAAAPSRVVETPAPAVVRPARAVGSPPTRQAVLDDPSERRLGGVPVKVIFGIVVVVVVLGALGAWLIPQASSLQFDDQYDPSTLPNTSAIEAGTPVADLPGLRLATPVVLPATTGASAASAAGAPVQPALEPGASPAPPVPASVPGAGPLAPQPVPSAAPAAPAAPGMLLDDHFADNANNWPSTSQGNAFVSNGTYRLATHQAGQSVAVSAPIAAVPSDLLINATFQKLSGPPGGGVGIIVRDQAPAARDGTSQDGRYYVLEAGDKGEVGIWRRESDHWVDLLPWQHSDEVKTGNAVNELTVQAVGDRLTLSVNGTQVATRTDDTLSGGSVGLFVGGDGNLISVLHFAVQAL